jgi:hypothetical protein
MREGISVIIDLNLFINRFSSYELMYWIYREIPLKIIINTLLSSDSKDDFIKTMSSIVISLSSSSLLNKTNDLEIFFEYIADKLNEMLLLTIDGDVDFKSLSFHSWIDNTAVILTNEY